MQIQLKLASAITPLLVSLDVWLCHLAVTWVFPPIGYLARLLRLDRVFPWRLFWAVARPYWTGASRGRAIALLVFTIVLMAISTKSAFYIGVCLKDFTETINSRSADSLFVERGLWLFVSVVIWTLAAVFYGFFRGWLMWDWRIADSSMRIKQWIERETFLRDAVVEMGNPDQRLIQDHDLFTEKAVLLPMVLLEALYGIWTFAPLLIQSSVWLALGCVLFAAITYVMVYFLGNQLAGLMGQKYESEAVMRTYLQRTAAQATSVALQRNENIVMSQSLERLAQLRDALWSVLSVNRNVSLWQTFWNKVVEHGPFAMIGWLYLHKQVSSFGSILQGVQAFQSVYGGLTVLAANWEGISLLRAECERLGPFALALEAAQVAQTPQGQWIEYLPGKVIEFVDVTVNNQYIDARPVAVNLSIQLADNVLFTATDGQGKPELAKAIGLGAARGTGKVLRPERNEVMFLTSVPFIPDCSLREFLTDNGGIELEERAILGALATVELTHIVARVGGLDVIKNWTTLLPVPQQQQLCLARLILARPLYAVMERATDAFEEEYENKIYSVLIAVGIKIVAFSNAERIAKHVDRVVELSPDGTVEVFAASEYHVPRWKALLRHFND